MALKASVEVKEKMKESSKAAEDSVAQIAEQIRQKSDAEIAKQTKQETRGTDAGAKRQLGQKDKIKIALSKLKSQQAFHRDYLDKDEGNITAMNEINQEKANAEAMGKLLDKKQEPEQLVDAEGAYNEHKMFEASNNATLEIERAETNDKLKKLEAWQDDHAREQQGIVNKFLNKVQAAESKDQEMNDLELQASHMAAKRDALRRIVKLHKEIPQLEQAKQDLDAKAKAPKGPNAVKMLQSQIEIATDEVKKAQSIEDQLKREHGHSMNQ